MQNTACYREKIEKELYSGAPKEVLEKLDKAISQKIENENFSLVSEIKELDFSGSEKLAQIQKDSINLAKNFTNSFLQGYDEHSATMGGRYI